MKKSIGIAIDGIEVRTVHLVRENKSLKVVSLSKETLLRRLDISEGEDKGGEEVSLKEIFGTTEAGEAKPKADSEDNSSIFLRVMGDVTSKGTLLALNVSESNILFHEIEEPRLGKNVAKMARKNLLKKLEAELKSEREDRFGELDFFKTDRGSVVALAFDPPRELLNLMSSLRSFVGAKFRVASVDSNMVALMNLVRADSPAKDEIEVIVYIGKEFSRVLFLKGGDYLRFSRVINEGADSQHILETVHSRVIFEQDEAGLAEVNRVILAGDVVRLGGKDFFSTRFPNAAVEYLTPPQFDLTTLTEEQRETICEYAIPLGLAWKALEPKHRGFYPTNLLPAQLAEMEKFVRITWHHIVIAALIVLSAFFFAGKNIQISSAIKSRKANISLVERQISQGRPLLLEVDQAEARLVSLGSAVAQLDTLEKSTPKWIPLCLSIAKGVRDLDGIWFTEFEASEGSVTLGGRSLYRNRVSSFSRYLEKPKLGEVKRAKIRDKEIYSFTYEAQGPGGKK